MRYEPEQACLHFGSPEEAERFHAELTELVRFMVTETGRDAPDAEQAKERSREVFQRFASVLRMLNALRKHVPHGEIR